MSKEQKIYTKEFKLEAVRLAETSGKPIMNRHRFQSRAQARQSIFEYWEFRCVYC